MNAWEKPGLTPEERAAEVWSEKSELQSDIASAIRAAVRGEREERKEKADQQIWNLQAKLDEARKDLDLCRKMTDRLRAMLKTKAQTAGVSDVLNAVVPENVIVLLVESFAKALDERGAQNYVEFTVGTSDQSKMYVCTVRRKDGKTPDQLKQEAEQDRDWWKRRAENAKKNEQEVQALMEQLSRANQEAYARAEKVEAVIVAVLEALGSDVEAAMPHVDAKEMADHIAGMREDGIRAERAEARVRELEAMLEKAQRDCPHLHLVIHPDGRRECYGCGGAVPGKEAPATTTESITLRPEVQRFAEAMEAQLRANDHKPGWKNDAPQALFERAKEEMVELAEAISDILGAPPELVLKEAADVANFAMMIADVCGGLATKEAPDGPAVVGMDPDTLASIAANNTAVLAARAADSRHDGHCATIIYPSLACDCGKEAPDA